MDHAGRNAVSHTAFTALSALGASLDLLSPPSLGFPRQPLTSDFASDPAEKRPGSGPPGPRRPLLLHQCFAVPSGGDWTSLLTAGQDFTSPYPLFGGPKPLGAAAGCQMGMQERPTER